MKKKMREKIKVKRKTKIYKLNFYTRQWGMLERYTPLTINLIRYYINDIKNLFYHKPFKVKIYIENPAGFTKEKIIPILIGMPVNVRFIWGKRKKIIK